MSTALIVPVAVDPMIVDPGLPADLALRQVAERVLGTLKYSFAVAAAEVAPAASGKLDRLFQTYVAARTPKTRTAFHAAGHALLSAPASERQRTFGPAASLSASAFAARGAEVMAGSKQAKLDFSGLLPKLRRNSKPDADQQAGMKYKRLQLRIARVRSVEGEVAEMSLGGFAIGAAGKAKPVREFAIAGGTTNRLVSEWTLETAPGGFPYHYTAVIATAEKDDAAFWQFFAKLSDLIRECVALAVAASVGAAYGRSLVPAIGIASGAVVGLFVRWMFSLTGEAGDSHTVQLPLWNSRASYYDGLRLTHGGRSGHWVRFAQRGGGFEVEFQFGICV